MVVLIFQGIFLLYREQNKKVSPPAPTKEMPPGDTKYNKILAPSLLKLKRGF